MTLFTQLQNNNKVTAVKAKANSGLTLMEIIIVIAIVALVYTIAIPQFQVASGTDVAVKVGQLNADIRSAFDMAVLSNRPYRLMFDLQTSEYWLETTDRLDFRISADQVSSDAEADSAAKKEEFENRFAQYVEATGPEVRSEDGETMIKPKSPILSAKSSLEPAEWKPLNDLEWGRRSIGPYLVFQDIQAEHHGQKQTLETLGEGAKVALYFLPGGFVEPCVIHIAYNDGSGKASADKEPYTLKVDPFSGMVNTTTGYQEAELERPRIQQ